MLSYDDTVGAWLAATTGERLVLLPAEDTAAAARIWASLSGTASAADDQARSVLDELTAGGLSRTPMFALLAWDQAVPATVRVIVRGGVRVTLDTAAGQVVLTGAGVSTWVEQDIDGVRRVEVCAPDAAPAHPDSLNLPLVTGMVRTSRLLAAFEAAAPAPSGSARRSAAVVPPPAPVAGPGHASVPTSVAGAVHASVPTPVPTVPTAPVPVPLPTSSKSDAIPEPASEQTITDIRPAADDAAPDAAAAPAAAPVDAPVDAAAAAPAPMDGYDHLFGATVMRGVEQAAVRPESESESDSEDAAPTAAPTAAPADADHGVDTDDDDDDAADLPDQPGDHDGHTVMSGDIQKLRDSQRRPRPAPAQAAAEAPRLYLQLPSGVRESLTQPIRVGRAPSVSKMSGEHVPRLVSLGGADQDVSRNHVHFTVEGDTVVVTDLHSRNGTLVVLPGKPPQKLRQGEPTAVIVGTVVDLGSGITITVGQE